MGLLPRIVYPTRYIFITSSPKWLITFTAMRPVEGLANGTDVSLLRDSQAWLTDTSPRPLATERVSVHWVGREP